MINNHNIPNDKFTQPLNTPIKQTKKQENFEGFKSDIINCANQIRNYVASHWFYISNMGGIAKRALKIVVLQHSELEARLGNIIASLGLLSGYSFYKSIGWDIPETYQQFWNRCELFHVNRDVMGTFFDTMSLIVGPADALDSLGIFTKNLATLGVISTIPFFSMIGLPVAIGLLTYVSAKGIYSILNRSLFLYHLTHASQDDLQKLFHEMDLTEEEKQKLQTIRDNIHTDAYHWDLTKKEENDLIQTLQKKLEQLDDEAARKAIKKEMKAIKKIAFVKAEKRNKLTRKTDEKVVEIMKKHQNRFEQGKKTENDLILRDIRVIIKRRIAIDCVNTVGHAALRATLIAEATLSGVFIQSVFLVRGAAFLSRKLYEDYWMYKNVASLGL